MRLQLGVISLALRNLTFHCGNISCACDLHFRTVKSICKRVQLYLGQYLLRWVVLGNVHSKPASVPGNSKTCDQGKAAIQNQIGAIGAVQVDERKFDYI